MPLTTTAKKPVVHGQYNRNGYEVWLGDHIASSAGNHVHDSTQPVLCKQDRLPLKTMRRFCIKTARVDAGWRVLFAFQRPWPRATQAGC